MSTPTAHTASWDYAARGLRLSLAWQADGLCLVEPDLPWTASQSVIGPDQQDRMTALCSDCPVASACAGYVEQAGIEAGYWAGAWRDPDHLASNGQREDLAHNDPDTDTDTVQGDPWAVLEWLKIRRARCRATGEQATIPLA